MKKVQQRVLWVEQNWQNCRGNRCLYQGGTALLGFGFCFKKDFVLVLGEFSSPEFFAPHKGVYCTSAGLSHIYSANSAHWHYPASITMILLNFTTNYWVFPKENIFFTFSTCNLKGVGTGEVPSPHGDCSGKISLHKRFEQLQKMHHLCLLYPRHAEQKQTREQKASKQAKSQNKKERKLSRVVVWATW